MERETRVRRECWERGGLEELTKNLKHGDDFDAPCFSLESICPHFVDCVESYGGIKYSDLGGEASIKEQIFEWWRYAKARLIEKTKGGIPASGFED